jgi:ABC-type glutathione transport system ATPase component
MTSAGTSDRLVLHELCVQIGARTVVDRVSLQVGQGELVGLVGSSGSGKTVTCRAVLGMVDPAPGVISGELEVTVYGAVHHPYRGLLGASRRSRDRAFRPLRGRVIGYLPQDAPAALDPFRRIGPQIQVLAPGEDPVGLLEQAGFGASDARRVAGSFAHQLSGGMAQRVVVAQALAQRSRFLLADEPTTALDPPLQRKILATLRGLADRGMGVLLVTHDLSSLSDLASRVVVMDQGQIVEELSPEDLRAGHASSDAGRRLLEAGLLGMGGAW